MPEVVATEQWIDQVAAEHRELDVLVRELRSFLREPRPGLGEKGFHTWASRLSEQLVRLHDRLFRHFRYEEQGGMVEDISLRHPRAARRVEDIVAEHGEMLRTTRRLMESALAYSAGEKPPVERLRSELTALLDSLQDHERRETELIQRVTYAELGAQD